MFKMMMKDWLIRATFLEILFISAATPQTRIQMMHAINSNLIAVRFLVSNLAIIVFTIIYDKYSDKIYKHYPTLMVIRLIVNSIIIGMVIFGRMNMVTYYICDMIIAALLSKTIGCCFARMKRYVYNSQQREKFDNYKHFGAAVAGIIGNSVALIGFPIALAWTFLLLAVVVDTGCSLMQYYYISKRI